MKMRYAALALLAPIALAGCSKVGSRSAFQDGNKAYKEENFKKAITSYQKALDYDPNMAEARFYLGSSYQALYRPGKETPENKANLDQAIEAYKAALEENKADTPNLKAVKANTLAALTGIYSEDPYKNYDEALSVANATPFGLSAGIVTTSLKHASHFQRNSESGLVMINLPTAGLDFFRPPNGTG